MNMHKITSQIIKELKKKGKKRNIDGMKKFAIDGKKIFGVSNKEIRELIKKIKKEIKEEERDKIAKELWNYGFHETKLIAGIIATPEIEWKKIEKWMGDCENWAQVDSLCLDLLWKLPNSKQKALKFTKSKDLWKKRTGFVIIAVLAVRFKNKLDPKVIKEFLNAIERESKDERNFIKKAVNWALRQIGKSVPKCREKTWTLAKKLSKSENKTERWIGNDALREFEKKFWKSKS